MLTKGQKMQLAELLLHKKEILFGKYSPSVTKELKNSAWDNILMELRSGGAIVKDVAYLRDKDWSNLKSAVLKRYRASLKSGAQGDSLSPLDSMVMDILGRDSPKVRGVGIDDMDVNFGGGENIENEFSFRQTTSTFPDLFDTSLANTTQGKKVTKLCQKMICCLLVFDCHKICRAHYFSNTLIVKLPSFSTVVTKS